MVRTLGEESPPLSVWQAMGSLESRPRRSRQYGGWNVSEIRTQIVAEIMSLVRQQPKKMEPPPTIEELEKILNSESTDEVSIETDGSVSVRPTMTTVGEIGRASCRERV